MHDANAIVWDSTNNRVIAADLNKGSVQIFDTNGTWVKNFGGQPQTRMQAAHKAIKALVTDSSLTSGVNFFSADCISFIFRSPCSEGKGKLFPKSK